MRNVKRLFKRFVLGAVISLCLVDTANSADVSIKTTGNSRQVQTSSYEAIINADGKLTKLCAGGSELASSLYFYQAGIPTMQIEYSDDKVIVVRGEKSSVKFEFGADKIDLLLTNLTAQMIQYVIVFDPGVTAVMNAQGDFFKTSVNCNWDNSTWFRGDAKLRVDSVKNKLWGPYEGNRQVWTTTLEPNSSRAIKLTISKATSDEMAKATAAPVYQAGQVKKLTSEKPAWNIKELEKAPKFYQADGFDANGCKAIYYDGIPYKGTPTRVFAWLGMPKLEENKKVPAVVLVHGGGGTAFAEWVRLWTSRGYAAIAMDTTGCVPRGAFPKWERHQWAGPPGWDASFKNIDSPLNDQWAYHAVADIILANSLLRSMPEVDADHIGLIGISWGGYLTCIAAGVDPRFRFAVPVYGCGYTLDTNFAPSVLSLGKERAERWMSWWDPSEYLKKSSMPMLWVDGSNDFAYTLNALQKSYRLPNGPRTLCIRLRMKHGHGGPGENPEEIRVFADTFMKGGVPLLKITGQGRDGNKGWVTYEARTPIKKAELNITKDQGNWSTRKWEALPADIDSAGKITAVIPDDTTVYYFNLFDERDCVVSTEHEEVKSIKERK